MPVYILSQHERRHLLGNARGNTVRTFLTEFPDFSAADIPAELLDASRWSDVSWHNELCPRFVSVATYQSLGQTCRGCVWVDHQSPELREEDSLPRFSVTLVTADDCDVPEAWADASGVDCDTWAEVVAAISTTTEAR
jgi:hypothetical protein